MSANAQRLLVPLPPPLFLAEGWTELVLISAPPALDSSLHAAPPPACFFPLSLCITGDASKLRPVQQQVDFFFLYGNYSRRFSQLNCIFFFTDLAVRRIYPDLPSTPFAGTNLWERGPPRDVKLCLPMHPIRNAYVIGSLPSPFWLSNLEK